MLRIFIRLPEIKQRYEYRIQETLRYFRGLVGCDSGGNLMNRGWAGGGRVMCQMSLQMCLKPRDL